MMMKSVFQYLLNVFLSLFGINKLNFGRSENGIFLHTLRAELLLTFIRDIVFRRLKISSLGVIFNFKGQEFLSPRIWQVTNMLSRLVNSLLVKVG